MLQKIENYHHAVAQLEQAVAPPRGVLKEAYAAGVISAPETWDAIIRSRNITSHVYDEQTAIEVANQICQAYLPTLQQLDRFYRA